MEKTDVVEKNNSLEIRKVAMVKYYVRGMVITTICFSILSLAFATGYIGTFLLFK